MGPGPSPPNPSPAAYDEIFDAATDLPDSEREAFVRDRCAGDPKLVQSVLALLCRFDRLGSFLNSPAASPSRTEPALAPGILLAGHFRLCEKLGQGGMGIVYRAEDLELGEPVALKMVRDLWLDDPSVLIRFREEIRLARKIAHPNVCRIYDLFTDTVDGRKIAFFTMEFLTGESLAERLCLGWRPSPEEILEVARGIAAGLDAAHASGVVHRDLKPANVIITPRSSVIMDFGLAMALESDGGTITSTGQIAGSPEYMAPEQFLEEKVTPAADIFSLAVIVYELVTGSRPWPRETLIRTALRRVSGTEVKLLCGPEYPRAWNEILTGAMARDPAARPQRATELVHRLETLVVPRAMKDRNSLATRRKILLASGAGMAVVLVFSRFTLVKGFFGAQAGPGEYPPRELASGHEGAMRELVRAEDAWNGEIHGKKADEAIGRLQRALELDPHFALAAARLGDLLVAIGREDEGILYQQKAVVLMDNQDLTDRLSLRILGMYYQDTGQDEKAKKYFRIWAYEYPTEGLPLFYIAKSLIRSGPAEEGYAKRARAAEMEPGNYALALGAAQALLEKGDLDGAENAAGKLKPGGLTGRLLACIQFGRFHADEVRRYIADIGKAEGGPFRYEAFALSACLLAECGELRKAELEIGKGLQAALRDSVQSVYEGKLILAKILHEQDRAPDVVQVCSVLLEEERGLRHRMEVGCVLARAGAIQLAKSCMPAPDGKNVPLLATPAYAHWKNRLLVEIAVAENDLSGARKILPNIPPPSLLDDWPEYQFAGYLAVRRNDRELDREHPATRLLTELLRNPGRYWRLADTTGPGYIRRSILQAKSCGLPRFLDRAALAQMQSLQKMLQIS